MDSTEARGLPVVVLVEEETDERLFIAEHLRDAGFSVLEAEDTDTGLSLLDGHDEVEALVTDAHVPGPIDGYELARLARERWPRMTVVMMSGRSDESSGPLPPGATFVSKPNLTSRLVPVLKAGRG